MLASPEIVLSVLAGRRLARHPLARGRRRDDALILSLPTRHRPVLRINAAPLEMTIWEILDTAKAVPDVVDAVRSQWDDIDVFPVLRAIADLERRGFITASAVDADPGRAADLPGTPWPAWRDVR